MALIWLEIFSEYWQPYLISKDLFLFQNILDLFFLYPLQFLYNCVSSEDTGAAALQPSTVRLYPLKNILQ